MEMGRTRNRLEDVLQAYVDSSKLAEQERFKEHRAVVLLQSAWRRKMAYILLRKWNRAALDIQRVYRGHVGRARYLCFSQDRDKALRMAYFGHRATLIQKTFRGYYSRKYVHSFVARKEFLQDARERGSEMKRELYEHYKNQCVFTYRDAQRKAQLEIDKFMDDNYINLSTESCRGVYYSPYLHVLGQPNQIEQKIREAGKRRNCVEYMKTVRCARPLPPPVLWRSASVLSTEPYMTKYDMRRQEERQAKLLQVNEQEFKLRLGRKSEHIRSMRSQEPYEFKPEKPDTMGWKKISDTPFRVSSRSIRRKFSTGA